MPVTMDRARGCLLGLAIGDALGAPVEGMPRQRIRRECGEVRDYLDPQRLWVGALGRSHVPGLYTDDTQQALLLADVLLENADFDPEAARLKYVELAKPVKGLPRGAHRAMGGNFRAALQRMVDGVPTLQTGVPSAGNGAAMRIAPLGLRYAEDAERRLVATVQASLQTHADARGVAAAVALASLSGYLATHTVQSTDEQRAALQETIARTQEAEVYLSREHGLPNKGGEPEAPRFSAALTTLAGVWEQPRWQVLRSIVLAANRQQPQQPVSGPSDGFAGASVPTAILLALSVASFEEALVEAVNLGGDADTVGAMTGALAGARWGANAIPGRWLDGLVNRDAIIARADGLAGGGKGSAGLTDLLAMERRAGLDLARRREAW
jgi:ADP-ribosyl-[dinitrogen reductase] hydrolase